MQILKYILSNGTVNIRIIQSVELSICYLAFRIFDIFDCLMFSNVLYVYRAPRAWCHSSEPFTSFLVQNGRQANGQVHHGLADMVVDFATASAPRHQPSAGITRAAPEHCNLQNGTTLAGAASVSARFLGLDRTDQNDDMMRTEGTATKAVRKHVWRSGWLAANRHIDRVVYAGTKFLPLQQLSI